MTPDQRQALAYLRQAKHLAQRRARHDQSLPSDTRADFGYIVRYIDEVAKLLHLGTVEVME